MMEEIDNSTEVPMGEKKLKVAECNVGQEVFMHSSDNLADALENLKFENKRFSDPSVSSSTKLGESKRERLQKMDELAGKAWEEFKENSGKFRKQNKNVVVGTKLVGDEMVDITLGDLEKEIDRFYPVGEHRASVTDEEFKSNTEDKIRLLIVYDRFLKDKSMGLKTSSTSFTGPLDRETLFAKPKDYWITAEGWIRGLDEDERGYKKKQSESLADISAATEDKSPTERNEFYLTREEIKDALENLKFENKRFSDPSVSSSTKLGESKRERLQKMDELAGKAWEEFKGRSGKFRKRSRNAVVGTRRSGGKVVNITLSNLEAEIDKFYPEGEREVPATDKEFKENTDNKVRLLSAYDQFLDSKLARKKMQPVSFNNPLDERRLFAKPKDYWITSEGWIRALDEDERGNKKKQPEYSNEGSIVNTNVAIGEEKKNEEEGCRSLGGLVEDLRIEGGSDKKELPDLPNSVLEADTEEKEKGKDFVFHLRYPRQNAKTYRLIKVDYFKGPQYEELEKTVYLLFWKVKNRTFSEIVGEDGQKVEGTSTYAGPLRVRFEEENEVKQKLRTKKIWGFGAQVDYFVNRFKAGLNTNPTELDVEVSQRDDKKK
jgi:hypothetical protein